MAYEEHRRVVFSGGLGTNEPNPEEFSFGLNFFSLADPDQGMADDMHAATKDFFDSAGSKIASAALLTTTKVFTVDTTGHVDGTVFLASDEGTPGGGGGPLHPFQCSLVVSLRTGLRGPAKRGRFYLPLPSIAVRQEDGEISTGDRDTVETAVGDWLGNLIGIMGVDGAIVVASQVVGNTPVTHFQVGRVIDTIRRRRRDLDESYGPLIAL